MMDMSDESVKASCLEWSTGKSSSMSPGLQSSRAYNLAFMRECNALYAANGVAEFAASGDAALAEKDYDRAIELYSAAIELDSATDIIFANRSKARLLKMLWEDALLDAEKVRWYLLFHDRPSSFQIYTGHRTQPFGLSWIPAEARGASWRTLL
jgi:hypothetical protein